MSAVVMRPPPGLDKETEAFLSDLVKWHERLLASMLLPASLFEANRPQTAAKETPGE